MHLEDPHPWYLLGRVNPQQGCGDTHKAAASCCLSPRWADSATSLSTQLHVKNFQHSLVFIWRTLILVIHHKGLRKLPFSPAVWQEWCVYPFYLLEGLEKLFIFLIKQTHFLWLNTEVNSGSRLGKQNIRRETGLKMQHKQTQLVNIYI